MERFLTGTADGTQPRPYTPERLLSQKQPKTKIASMLANHKLMKPLPSAKANPVNGHANQTETTYLLSLNEYPSLKTALEGSFPCSDVAHINYSYTCQNRDKDLSVDLAKGTGAITHKDSERAPQLEALRFMTHQMRQVLAAVASKQEHASVGKMLNPSVNMGVLPQAKPSKSIGVAATVTGKAERILADKKAVSITADPSVGERRLTVRRVERKNPGSGSSTAPASLPPIHLRQRCSHERSRRVSIGRQKKIWTACSRTP